MDNEKNITPEGFIEQIKKDYNLDINVDAALKYVCAKAEQLHRIGKCVVVSDDTVKEWVLNGVEDIKSGKVEPKAKVEITTLQKAPTNAEEKTITIPKVELKTEKVNQPSMREIKEKKDKDYGQISLFD